jgi:hypothetical protein
VRGPSTTAALTGWIELRRKVCGDIVGTTSAPIVAPMDISDLAITNVWDRRVSGHITFYLLEAVVQWDDLAIWYNGNFRAAYQSACECASYPRNSSADDLGDGAFVRTPIATTLDRHPATASAPDPT